MSFSKEELVKTGKIVKSKVILFNKLFSLRQEADYEDFTEIKADELTFILPEVERLIYEIDKK